MGNANYQDLDVKFDRFDSGLPDSRPGLHHLKRLDTDLRLRHDLVSQTILSGRVTLALHPSA